MRPFLFFSLALHLALLAFLWWVWPATPAPAPVRLTIQTGEGEKAGAAPGGGSSTTVKGISPAPALIPPVPADGAVSGAPFSTDSPKPAEAEPPGDFEGPGQGEPMIDALTSGPVVEKPSLIGYPSPGYPREARRRGWEGSVEIEVEIDAAGTWITGRVVRSSGHGILDNAAMEALRQARYQPATRNGVPEPGLIDAVVRFRLK